MTEVNMDNKKIRKTESLKALIEGKNLYTGEVISGLDENLKSDLSYILDKLIKVLDKKKEKSEEQIVSSEKTIVLRRGMIVVDGNKYMIDDGALYDKEGMRFPDGKANDIIYKYYTGIDYSKLDEEQLTEFIKGIKNSGFFKLCVGVIEEELKNYTMIALLRRSCQYIRVH